MPASQYYYGIGRRKSATAQARIFKGTGEVTVNNQAAVSYLGHPSMVERLRQPLTLLGKDKEFDVSLRVSGGGKSGQVDAGRLAIAKALQAFDVDFRPTLKKAGHLKRDARIKERKKYGLKRARKAPQFTKR